MKMTVKFLGCNHRVDQAAFALTREACNKIGILVSRVISDGYGPLDFRVDPASFTARIQDKVESDNSCGLRPSRRHPYNPDSVDILQITNITTKVVYAIPMRVLQDSKVVSCLTAAELMAPTICLSIKWKEQHSAFRHDLQTEGGARTYVAACEAASRPNSQVKHSTASC